MVVALNGSWKIPVSYYLIDSLTGGLPPTSVSFLTSEKTHVHFVTHFLKTLLLTLREMRNFTDEFSHLLDIATLQFAFVA
jgi:hypothetical protein